MNNNLINNQAKKRATTIVTVNNNLAGCFISFAVAIAYWDPFHSRRAQIRLHEVLNKLSFLGELNKSFPRPLLN